MSNIKSETVDPDYELNEIVVDNDDNHMKVDSVRSVDGEVTKIPEDNTTSTQVLKQADLANAEFNVLLASAVNSIVDSLLDSANPRSEQEASSSLVPSVGEPAFTERLDNGLNTSVDKILLTTSNTNKKGSHHCTSCDTTFKAQVQFEKHMKEHPGIFLYYCGLCDFHTNFKQKFKSHTVSKHSSRDPQILYKCDKCDKGFSQLFKLKKHAESHSFIRPHSCSQCNYSTTSKGNLELHIKRKHSTSPPAYVCPDCDKTFVYLSDYQRHQVIHTKQKNYPCSLCTVQCNRKSNLKKHFERVHMKLDLRIINKSHCCKECEKCFSSNCDLVRHINGVHSKNRPFACDKCNYHSDRKSNLTRHLLCKHGYVEEGKFMAQVMIQADYFLNTTPSSNDLTDKADNNSGDVSFNDSVELNKGT